MATILVVDDHRVHQRMYSYTLRKHGHSVLLADHGRMALEHMQQQPVDLVITDIAMPEMNGLELLKHLRNDERYRTLPVILLTASGQEQDQFAARDNGANAFLIKPISSRELVETVLTLLGGRIIGGQV